MSFPNDKDLEDYKSSGAGKKCHVKIVFKGEMSYNLNSTLQIIMVFTVEMGRRSQFGENIAMTVQNHQNIH